MEEGERASSLIMDRDAGFCKSASSLSEEKEEFEETEKKLEVVEQKLQNNRSSTLA